MKRDDKKLSDVTAEARGRACFNRSRLDSAAPSLQAKVSVTAGPKAPLLGGAGSGDQLISEDGSMAGKYPPAELHVRADERQLPVQSGSTSS